MNDAHGQPMATYRLQFNREFRFADAQALVPYFSRLGVTHAYASPILRARRESMHGYDVVDPANINPNLGDENDLRSFVTGLQNFGLALLLDIVPNHIAANMENPYWRDVLTYGPSSPFARWFDIDWRMPEREMWGRVLAPVLGEPLARVLQKDQIRIEWSEGRFLVRYFEHSFPIDPATVPSICRFGMHDLKQLLPDDHSALEQIREILTRLEKLPKLVARLRRRVQIDRNETELWLAQFAQLVVQSPRIEEWARETAQRFGAGEDGRRRLRKLLDAQPYRLVHWREAARKINYRRFFDINELISIRQEDPQVFDETHATVIRWTKDGLIGGLRIDHIDGLRDPLGYLERLVESINGGRRARSLPIFVEKILAADEKLPCGWPVEGTTGYDFLNQVEAIFVAPRGFAEIENGYRRLLRREDRFEQIAAQGKRRVLRNDLSPHVGRLADILLRLAEIRSHATASLAESEVLVSQASAFAPSEGDNVRAGALATLPTDHRDLTKRMLSEALVEVIVALPVYRTYIDSAHLTISEADRHYLETALVGAHRSGRAAPAAIDFLGEVLLLAYKADLPEREIQERANFIQRFQQLTGPAAAKGIEDTALYAYVPLTSLNEVGGEPKLPADDPVRALHRTNEERRAAWPRAMLGVTTHDTKRTADVRARLDVLSELPELWLQQVRRWQRTNRPHRARAGGKTAPDPAAEYLFYQTVVGLWPAPDPARPHELPQAGVLVELRERIEAYMVKAVREAKTNTSWTQPNQEYEDALQFFVRSLLLSDVHRDDRFLSDVQTLVVRIARPGFWNSLSRTLIQFTAPGTPDLYQGDEIWNFALVDPDNRRPVDYQHRQRLLDEVVTGSESPPDSRQAFLENLVNSAEDGRIKLHVIRTALGVRREHPALFAAGDYLPLSTDGPGSEHLFAFARRAGDEATLVVVPRLTTGLVTNPADAPIGKAVWSDTTIALPESWQNRAWTCALTGEQIVASEDGRLEVARVLEKFPASLLLIHQQSPEARGF